MGAERRFEKGRRLWEVEVSHAVQLFYEMSSRRKLYLFDAEFESYSDRNIIKVS